MKVLDLFEAREPDLTYTEKRVKNALDKVTLELEGKESAAMSRLTLRYYRLDKAAKLMAEKRNELNAQMKMVAESLFDAEDAVLTRVIETASCTIMLTKAEKAADKESTKKIDYAAIVGELAALLPELEARIKALTKKYTEVIEAKDTPTQLRVKSKVEEGILDTVKGWAKSFLAEIKSWGKSYDKRLADIKKQIKGMVTEAKSDIDAGEVIDTLVNDFMDKCDKFLPEYSDFVEEYDPSNMTVDDFVDVVKDFFDEFYPRYSTLQKRDALPILNKHRDEIYKKIASKLKKNFE